MMRTSVIPALALPIAAAVIVVVASSDSDDLAVAEAVGSTSTASTQIKRQDLVEIQTAAGTLGYADARTVANRLRGTVTWLPPAGRVVRVDRTLYKVDDEPVILMDGRVPAFRPLGPGASDGADIRQLKRSLREAGYDRDRGIVIDDAWSAATTAAVKRWQDAHRLPETGRIELGRIAFLPGTRRIADASARGLRTTSTRRLVTVALDTTDAAVAKEGARVTVELPSDEGVAGRITSVGKVATATPREPSAPAGEAEATITVKVRLLSGKTALDQAPVTVRFEQSRRKNVLAIPVTALLARPGGGFAVQRVNAGGTRRVVPVKPGVYTSGYVEIAGAGLREGQRVTNAAVR